MRVVEFILGNELFAIDLFDTREVINTTEITPLPNTPSFIKGIIDLRGVIRITSYNVCYTKLLRCVVFSPCPEKP